MGMTRRDFVRAACCTAGAFGAATNFSRFGLMHALAQSSTQFQALVCIFLFGGNDSNNMLIPMDTAGYANYLQNRGAQSTGGLALTQTSLLPIASKTAQNASTSFGLHPNLPEVQGLYTGGQLAFLANVGTLSQPLTRAQYLGVNPKKPANLFSHADQQEQWQTLQMDGFYRSGWAGRLADSINPVFNTSSTFPPITSVAGSAIFGTGIQTSPYAIIPGSTPGLLGFDTSAAGQARLLALQQLLTFDTGVSLIQPASSITSTSLGDSKTLSAALAAAPALTVAFPTTGVGPQLKQVAQILSVRSALNLNRQVFFCSLGGFDTHSGQIATQQTLFTGLSAAMLAFYNATVELNLAQNVTTFTMSDFSRTYQPGSNGGSDHAWGSVQMIMGGAVHGGDIYGTLPIFTPNGPSDVGTNGRWIPTTSADQYGATLADWFGVPSGSLATVFPNLANFTAANLPAKLGFLG
jgi:uncharacterized protein (DUF1501 family)